MAKSQGISAVPPPDDPKVPGEDSGNAVVDSTRDALADRIRTLRRERGLSGRYVATQIGVTSGYISQIELGVATPSVATLVKLAGLFEVAVGDLFESQQPAGRLLVKGDRDYVRDDARGASMAYLGRDPRLSVVHVKLDPGGEFSTTAMGLSADSEHVLVTKGSVVVTYDGGNIAAGADDAVHFSNGAFYGCKNQSRSPAEFLWVVGTAF
jgi:transcriptional regulator with XRE-family HTH domain